MCRMSGHTFRLLRSPLSCERGALNCLEQKDFNAFNHLCKSYIKHLSLGLLFRQSMCSECTECIVVSDRRFHSLVTVSFNATWAQGASVYDPIYAYGLAVHQVESNTISLDSYLLNIWFQLPQQSVR